MEAADSVKQKRKKNPNWEISEEIVLVEEIGKREKLLFGSLSGGCVTTQTKRKEWETVTAIVNSQSKSVIRNVDEIKKKYQNIKSKARNFRTDTMRPKTGGGPRVKSPSVPEKIVLNHISDRPSIRGIIGGIDTEERNVADSGSLEEECLNILSDIIPLESTSTVYLPEASLSSGLAENQLSGSNKVCVPCTNSDVPEEMEVVHQKELVMDTNSMQLTPIQRSKTFKKSGTKSNFNKNIKSGLEDEILKEELKRIKESRELIRQEIKLAKLRQNLTIIQIKKFDPLFMVNDE